MAKCKLCRRHRGDDARMPAIAELRVEFRNFVGDEQRCGGVMILDDLPEGGKEEINVGVLDDTGVAAAKR